MKISFSPVRSDMGLAVSVSGTSIIANGEAFDLADLLPGYWIDLSSFGAGNVLRAENDGDLTVTLLLPHTASAQEARKFPSPNAAPDDGPVVLPGEDVAVEWDGESIDVSIDFSIAQPMVPRPVASDVKAEAGRRIVDIMPEHKQRNFLALAIETMQTHGTDPSAWPPGLKSANAGAIAQWSRIKAIRAKSNEIEALDPIPPDFRDDSYWT